MVRVADRVTAVGWKHLAADQQVGLHNGMIKQIMQVTRVLLALLAEGWQTRGNSPFDRQPVADASQPKGCCNR
jgi:hypothetical protein